MFKWPTCSGHRNVPDYCLYEVFFGMYVYSSCYVMFCTYYYASSDIVFFFYFDKVTKSVCMFRIALVYSKKFDLLVVVPVY